jgi:hypothetical protein
MTGLQQRILAVLEGLSSLCLDDPRERELVAAALECAIRSDPNAVLIRRMFAGCATPGGTLTVTRTIGGKHEYDLLEAAGRLAGCWEPTSLANSREATTPEPAAMPRATTVLPPRPKRARRSRTL